MYTRRAVGCRLCPCNAVCHAAVPAANARCDAGYALAYRWPTRASPPCLLAMCSGTTGTPKGVMATHRNYVSGIAGARNLLVQVGTLQPNLG